MLPARAVVLEWVGYYLPRRIQMIIRSQVDLKEKTVSNNYDGIIIEFCSNTTLRNNNMFNSLYNFGVGGGQLPYFINDIDTSNKVERNRFNASSTREIWT